VPGWLEAGLWGLLGGGALVLGALIAWFVRVPQVVIASVMAFGSGVLISAVAFDLMAEADERGGLLASAVGFLLGALVYLAATTALARRGARHRKRSGASKQAAQPREDEQQGSGAAIAVGALLDGIPESVVIGIGLLDGGAVSLSVVAAVFISNVPEGLSSAAGMKNSGRSADGSRRRQQFRPGDALRTPSLAAGRVIDTIRVVLAWRGSVRWGRSNRGAVGLLRAWRAPPWTIGSAVPSRREPGRPRSDRCRSRALRAHGAPMPASSSPSSRRCPPPSACWIPTGGSAT
jgi:hypothetical protein